MVNKNIVSIEVANDFIVFIWTFVCSFDGSGSMDETKLVTNPFLSLCRVCTRQRQDLNDLFTTFMNNCSLAETLALCTQKTIAIDDGLSALICIECMGNLIVAFEFHTLCAASETKVRQFLDANTHKITSESIDEPAAVAVDYVETTSDDIRAEIERKEPIGATKLRPIECIGNNWRKKTFECMHCKKLFPKLYNLRRHIRIHDETGKPFECPVCRWRFSSANNLKRHAIKHTDILANATTRLQQPTSFPCRLCSRAFSKKESLASHMKIHKNDAPLHNATVAIAVTCELCSKHFAKAEQLTRHMRSHDEMKAHQCKICAKRFAHNGTLIDHMNRHNNIKPHQCPYCQKSFHQSCTLKEHIRTHTQETRKLSNSLRLREFQVIFFRFSAFLCSECGKAFNNRSNLRQHLIRHSGEKPYPCNQCPSRFSCRAGLRSHLSCHSGLRPHVCDTCGSAFTKSSSLAKHNRIHTGLRPYPCELCGMRFICSDHLKRHYRVHSGEKRNQSSH